MILTTSIYINPRIKEIGDLNKQATALKASGQIEAAIECLYTIKTMIGEDYEDTRLAKFLQHAGRVDEALAEIDWLLARVDIWAKRLFGHQPASVARAQAASKRSRIHKDAALICKRAKLDTKQARHEELAQQWHDKWALLNPVAREDMRRKDEEYKAASQRGPAAVAAFMKKYGR